MNLKQRMMTVKYYALKFLYLFCYALDNMSSMRKRIRKFCLAFSEDFILDCKATISNNDMDISNFVVYM